MTIDADAWEYLPEHVRAAVAYYVAAAQTTRSPFTAERDRVDLDRVHARLNNRPTGAR